jgi:hypothetical protein
MSSAERHTANPDVWVAAAKMFAVVGRKLAESARSALDPLVVE